MTVDVITVGLVVANAGVVGGITLAAVKAQMAHNKCIAQKMNKIGKFLVKQKIYDKLNNPVAYEKVFKDTDDELGEFVDGDDDLRMMVENLKT